MKILIVGLGSIAKKHIGALMKIDLSAQIFALRSNIHAESIENIHNLYSVTDIEKYKLFFDFAIISNPTSLHKETIEQLITLNIPLFIEKPLFEKLYPASIIDDIINKDIATYVACNLRFLESLKFAREFIVNKRINEVNTYCGSYLPTWRNGQDFRKSYSANKDMGGGVHIDLIHEFDYIYWFFNSPKTVNRHFANNSSLNISSIDYANYLLEYDSFCVNIILNYYRKDSKRTLEVICEDGTLEVNLLKNKVYWNNDLIFESEKGIQDTYYDQLLFFVNNILTRKSSFNNVREAYETLKICIPND